MPLFEEFDDEERDRIIISADSPIKKNNKKEKEKKPVAVARPVKRNMSRNKQGNVVGYLSKGMCKYFKSKV